jgi:hypothetical protein
MARHEVRTATNRQRKAAIPKLEKSCVRSVRVGLRQVDCNKEGMVDNDADDVYGRECRRRVHSSGVSARTLFWWPLSRV